MTERCIDCQHFVCDFTVQLTSRGWCSHETMADKESHIVHIDDTCEHWEEGDNYDALANDERWHG